MSFSHGPICKSSDPTRGRDPYFDRNDALYLKSVMNSEDEYTWTDFKHQPTIQDITSFTALRRKKMSAHVVGLKRRGKGKPWLEQ